MTEVKPKTWNVNLHAYVKRVQLSASFAAVEAETEDDAVAFAIGRADDEADMHWVPTSVWLND